MKTTIAIFILLGIQIMNAQEFLNYYSSDGYYAFEEQPYPTQMQFTCITDKGSNFLIAGPQNAPAVSIYGMALLEVNSAGGIISSRSILLGTTNAEVIPTGILYETDGTNQYAIICGYWGQLGYVCGGDPIDPDKVTHAFVLKYNLTTSTLAWVSNFWHDFNCFFDIDFNTDGDYILCGEYSNSTTECQNTQDAFIVKALKSSGSLSVLYRARALASDATSDTYYACLVNNDNVLLSHRFEHYTTTQICGGIEGGGFEGMRAGATKYDMGSGIHADKLYIDDIGGECSRMYAVDIARSRTNYVMAIHGDLGGELLNHDLFLIKINSSLTSAWQKKVQFGGVNDFDGYFRSVKTFSVGMVNDIIAYGSDGNDVPFLIRVNNAGTSIAWSNNYPGFSVPATLAPNSMIIKGNDIYVVGNSVQGDEQVGVLLKVTTTYGNLGDLGDPYGCSPPFSSSLEDVNFSKSFTPINPNFTHYVSTPFHYENNCAMTRTIVCHNNTRVAPDGQLEIIVTNTGLGEISVMLPEGAVPDEYTIRIFNAIGQIVLEMNLGESQTFTLPKGFYLYKIMSANTEFQSGKILVMH